MSSDQTGTSTELLDGTEGPESPERPQSPYATMLAILGGGLAIALIVIAIGFAIGGGDGGEGGSGGAVPVTLSEFAITGDLKVAPGGTLAVTNEGTQVHNLIIEDGAGTSDLSSGASENLTVDVAAGDHVVYCSIPGHREAGMEATLTVAEGVEIAAGAEGAATEGGGGAAGGGGATSGMSHDNLTPEEAKKLDAAMVTSFQPFVDQLTSGELNTEGVGGETLDPTIGEDGVKEWNLTAEIVDWEVSPGQVVKAWTYNGTVPAPTLRGEVGDRIRINLTNKLPLATDLHMHGMVLPNDQDGVSPVTQDPILPGETYTYEYEVTEPAIAMYHPHIHGMDTIPDGMWGAMIFSPAGGGGTSEYTIPYGKTISGRTIPADLKIAQEDNMVLNDAGVIGLSLNGKSFPATKPYSLKQGDWMLVNYYNEGRCITRCTCTSSPSW